MKKLFNILIFMLLAIFLHAAPSITKTAEGDGDKSNPYFPLITGQKWTYTITAGGVDNTVNWRLNGSYKITDTDNGINNAAAYQVESIETGEIWYFLKYDGFVCKYEQNEKGNYILTRLLPDSINIDYNWISANTSFIISEVNADTVKVEFVSNAEDFSGYNVFKKDIGPSEMYIFDTAGGDKSDTTFKLKEAGFDRTVQQAAVTIPAVSEVADAATSDTTIKTETAVETTTPAEEEPKVATATKPADEEVVAPIKEEPKAEKTIEETYPGITKINRFKEDFFYIQVGSFVIKNNAFRICSEVKTKGFNAVLFEDTDGYFKVLIEGNKDMEFYLNKARNEINAGAFMKKRLK